MSTLTVLTALAGMIVGAGVWLLIKAAVPPNPQLAGALARLGPDNLRRRDPATGPAGTAAQLRRDRIGRWVEQRLAGRTGLLAAPTADLQVLQISPGSYWGDKAITAALGFLAPIVLHLANLMLASPVPAALPAIASPLLAGLFWFLPDQSIRKKAAQRRSQFVRAAVAYLQIVAIHRRAEAGATTALREAADISDSWMFTRLREEIRRAQVTGIPAWEGLEQLGARTGIPELSEVGEIMRLAGDAGGAVYEPLLARAKTLSDRIMAEDQTQALTAATNVNAPVGALVGVLMIFILYPVMTTLMTT
ncbi:type II secretion system F family protein [Intrasporangium sp.]|uniref:type II secretion system F family protein n=1 Tax=Intrasporangium sp. TaxID=1925024 RepID=UPI0032215909